jgi:uncharacterized protein (DUF3820 family)
MINEPDSDVKERPNSGFLMPYGKHRGVPLKNVPLGYLSWWIEQANIKPRLRGVVEQFLGVDQPEGVDPEPNPSSAAVVLPGLIFEWKEHMWSRYSTNGELLEVAKAGLEKLKEQCSRYTRKPWPAEVENVSCKRCGVENIFLLRWQTFSNGMRNIRLDCGACLSHIRYIPQTPEAIAEADRTTPFESKAETRETP